MYCDRVLYYLPAFNISCGGIKVIQDHVNHLCRNGIDALAVYDRPTEITWYRHNTPKIGLEDALSTIRESDTVVIPEICPEVIGMFRQAQRKILFAQNWAYMAGPMKRSRSRTYKEMGYTGVMTCGRAMTDEAAKTGFTSGLPVYTVTNSIDSSVFYPGRAHEENSILMLSRKNISHVYGIMGFFAIKHLLGRQSPSFRIVDRVQQETLAELYRQTDIYVHVGFPEGFGYPPLEAMASGCAVAGYSGRGGNDFMMHGQTALVARDGALHQLVLYLQKMLTHPELKETLRARGTEKSREFTPARQEKELLAAFAGTQP